MTNTTFTSDSGIEHIVVEHADGSFTTYVKADYDKQQAEQSTPIVTSDE
jgi:hypothetical protein